MSDVELLFLVLAVIYGWECVCWLPCGTVAFRTWFGRRWRAVHPGTLAGNQRGGFVLAHPLPPLGTLVQPSQFPLSVSDHGVLAFVAANPGGSTRAWQPGAWLLFADITRFHASGKRILADGQLLARTGSASLARNVVEQLSKLQKAPLERRSKALDEIAAACLDAGALRELWESFNHLTKPLRLLANGLFVYLLAVAPAAIWWFGFGLCWPWLILGLLAFTLPIAVSFRRVHRQFFPAAEDERFTQFIILLLSPANAVRALDVLSRPLLDRFHPLAAAFVLCPETRFKDFAARVLRDLLHPALPACPVADPMAQAAEQQSRQRLIRAMERFLKKTGIDSQELLRPPAKADPGCRAYCPRCQSQFIILDGACEDCGGLRLVAF